MAQQKKKKKSDNRYNEAESSLQKWEKYDLTAFVYNDNESQQDKLIIWTLTGSGLLALRQMPPSAVPWQV